ncbi:aldehyde dehydrogenase family protein [Achromobacter kerstersii]
MIDHTLPRVTYSNIHTDFSAVHNVLDQRLPDFESRMLGLDYRHRFDGRAVAGEPLQESYSPIDHWLLIGRFPSAGADTVDQAIACARHAQPAWAGQGWTARIAVLRRLAMVLSERKYDFAMATMIEIGKSRMEALGEAEEAVDLIRYYCDQAERSDGYRQPLARAFDNESTHDVLRPYGVFAVIAPFNFPLALSVNMVCAALLAGNAVVYKPSPRAALTGALLLSACDAAGVPPGCVNGVFGGAQTGAMLAHHADVDGYAFTGSLEVGMDLLQTVAQGRHARPVIAEMGGKNPTYVTASADLDVAVQGVVRSAFGLQGQKCSAGSKVYAHVSVHDAFLERLCAATEAVSVGDPRDRSVFMGPLIDEAAWRRYRTACEDVSAAGRLLAGGRRLSAGELAYGHYVRPAVAAGLPCDHRLNRKELFLPFVSVLPFTDLHAAIDDGNNVDYGLTAGCYAQKQDEIDLFLNRAQAGALYVNRASGATTGAWPGIQTFCGWKGSGMTGKGGLGPYYVAQFAREQSHTVWHR